MSFIRHDRRDVHNPACWCLGALLEELQPAASGQQGVPDAVRGKDGAPMVLIPARAFTMGSNEGLPC